jgi:hypothetical protein
MPKPKKGESKTDYLTRCTKEVVKKEGKDADQAYAMCNRYWDQEKSQRSALSLSAPLALAGEDKLDSFLITAYTGQLIDLGFWGKFIIDVAGLQAGSKIPILREHQRDRVVGYSTKTWKDGHNFLLAGDFSKATPTGSEVLALAREGFPWQASIGVWPKKVKVLENDKETVQVNGQELKGPLEIWTESYVREVSFVALGADDQTAGITLALDTEKVPVSIERAQNKEDGPMEITLQFLENEAPGLLGEIQTQAWEEGLETGRIEGVDMERARVKSILEAEADQEATKQAILEGIPVEAAFKMFFEAEKAFRDDALKKLKEAAPPPQGQEPPKDPETEVKDPDAKLAQMARELAEKEGIPLDEATERVFAENPELAGKWMPQPEGN